MSLADMQKPSYFDISSSLSDQAIGNNDSSSSAVFDISTDNMLTIEELRAHIGSCFTCGVSWSDDHVSLDCSECGGYSSQRPCPLCDGDCGEIWKRDFSMSHACSKARWIGHCLTITDSPLYTVLPPSVAAALMTQQRHNVAAAAAAATSATCYNDNADSNNSTVAMTSTHNHHHQQAQITCGASQFLAHDLCMRLERLSAATSTQT